MGGATGLRLTAVAEGVFRICNVVTLCSYSLLCGSHWPGEGMTPRSDLSIKEYQMLTMLPTYPLVLFHFM